MTAHETASIAATGVGAALTLGALTTASLRQPLGYFMLGYMLLDSLWISNSWARHDGIVPSVPAVIGHHLFTAIPIWHGLTYPAHAYLIPWCTASTLNTLVLFLRRRSNLGGLAFPLFALSWIGLRLVFLPCVAVRMAFFAGGWATVAPVRKIVVTAALAGLALLPAFAPVPGDLDDNPEITTSLYPDTVGGAETEES